MRDDLKEFQESMRQVLDAADLAADELSTWQQLAELGWLMVPIPEDQDGLGMGAPGMFLILLELGRRLGTVPYLPALLGIDAVCSSLLANKAEWLERLMTGELLTAAAVDSGYEISVDKKGEAHISGLAEAVQSADKASHILVWDEKSQLVALVPIDQAGVELNPQTTWDTTRCLFDLNFTDVEIDPGLILFQGQPAKDAIDRLLALRDLAIAADCLGGASALLEMTIEHLNTRFQYGRPLALFQALKHRCANLQTQIMAAEALVFDILDRYGDSTEEGDVGVKLLEARFLASQAYYNVAEEALQLHGGIGMAEEHPCHLFLKRAMLNQHLGHSANYYETAIADAFIQQAG